MQFVGPGFSLKFALGACALAHEEDFLKADKTKTIACTEPEITYAKTPAAVTLKHKAGDAFVGKECKVEKVFGEATVRVLYVFDGASNPEIGEIAGKVGAELRGALSSYGDAKAGVAAQMATFLGGKGLGGVADAGAPADVYSQYAARF